MTRVHRFWESLVLVAVLGVFGVGVVGLIAAIAGVARPEIVFPGAGALVLVLLLSWGRGHHRGGAAVARPSRPVPAVALVLGLLIIGVSGFAHARHNGQYVRTDRDPGIYTAGGLWVAEHGDLYVDGLVGGFDESQSLTAVASGQWAVEGDPTRLEIQGQHLFPVLLAAGEWVGGITGYQLVPAAIGSIALAAFFTLCLRILRWWLAVAATAALATNFVFLYAVRSTLSEPTSLLFATAGLWLLFRALEQRSPRRLLVAGAVIGATLCTRIDGGVAVAALPIAVAISSIVIERRDGCRSGWSMLGSFTSALLALFVLARIDLHERSSFYARHQMDKIRLVELGLVIGIIASILVLGVGRAWMNGSLGQTADRLSRERSRVARIAAVGVVVVFAFLWFARPLLGPARSPMSEGGLSTMEAIQKKEGVAPDPTRSFDEASIERIAWYIGDGTMILAIGGLAVLVYRTLTRPDGDRSALLLAAITPTLLLYVMRPSIFPDQPWMMRRYLPIVIPGLLIAAVVAISAALDTLPRLVENDKRQRELAGIGVVAAITVMLLGPLQITKPLRSIRWMAGGYHGMENLCAALGSDASVIFSNSEATAVTLMPSFRGMCDLPAARPAQQPFVDPLPIEEIREAVEDEGRRLWVIGPTPESLEGLVPGIGEPEHLVIVSSDILEATMFYPPARTVPQHVEVWYAPVDVAVTGRA